MVRVLICENLLYANNRGVDQTEHYQNLVSFLFVYSLEKYYTCTYICIHVHIYV